MPFSALVVSTKRRQQHPDPPNESKGPARQTRARRSTPEDTSPITQSISARVTAGHSATPFRKAGTTPQGSSISVLRRTPERNPGDDIATLHQHVREAGQSSVELSWYPRRLADRRPEKYGERMIPRTHVQSSRPEHEFQRSRPRTRERRQITPAAPKPHPKSPRPPDPSTTHPRAGHSDVPDAHPPSGAAPRRRAAHAPTQPRIPPPNTPAPRTPPVRHPLIDRADAGACPHPHRLHLHPVHRPAHHREEELHPHPRHHHHHHHHHRHPGPAEAPLGPSLAA